MINSICEDCENKNFCKYYKIAQTKNIENYIFPEFLTVLIENGEVCILDCDYFKSVYMGGF